MPVSCWWHPGSHDQASSQGRRLEKSSGYPIENSIAGRSSVLSSDTFIAILSGWTTTFSGLLWTRYGKDGPADWVPKTLLKGRSFHANRAMPRPPTALTGVTLQDSRWALVIWARCRLPRRIARSARGKCRRSTFRDHLGSDLA